MNFTKIYINIVIKFIDVIRISDVEIRGKSHKMDIYEVLKVIN